IYILNKYNPLKFKLILVTGKRLYEKTIKSVERQDSLKNHSIVSYINDMPYALKACDLIVCSAGAITIAEVTAVGKPAILIPKAYTAEDHQQYNANAMADKGAAFVINENELNGEILNKKIEEILNDREVLKSMETASKKGAIIDAADRIYNEIDKLLNS
ncbi:MAG TPA: glycosyltransferase, partial [Clostridia bacterium]|nr:glycosyltransferase [Clostridia bacterium]